MLRIVDGFCFEGKPSADRWSVSVLDLGNGHKEASIRQAIDWTEVPYDPAVDAAHLSKLTPRELEALEEEKRQANRERSARRAKTRVRRLCKLQGLDTLLTLTYRANQCDLALCKGHMKAFIRKLRDTLGGFAYVAAFERQKRGAWHVHIACHRLPVVLNAANGVKVKSYNVIRAMWRKVTGELGGNIDQARRRRNAAKSAARCASYLSKYILKAFEDGDDWSNRYSSSGGVQLPPPARYEFRTTDLAELISLVHGELDAPGGEMCAGHISRFGDMVFLAVEPSQFDRSIHCRG